MTSKPPPGRAPAEAFDKATRLHHQNRLEEAVQAYSALLASYPEDDRLWSNLGVALKTQDKHEASEAAYRRAIAINPGNAGAHSNLGNTLRRLGRLGEAAAMHKHALTLDSGFADAYYNLGLVLHDMGRTAEAVRLFNKALSLDPSKKHINWDRCLALLLGGDLKRGFKEYEWRWTREELPPRPFRKPRWKGEDLKGRTLLVYAEQGFGDTLQFCRYLPLVDKGGGRVVFECQQELLSLMQGLEGPDEVVARGDRLPDFDLQVPLLTLPAILGTQLDSIPGHTPYLKVPPGKGFPVAKPEGTRLSVGIAWAGKPTHKNDHNRSLDLELFLDLAALPGVTLYSLQKGPRAEDRQARACGALIRDLGSAFNDFGDTAAALAQLDLVITVDTGVAHLAGALNRPVWVLLPYSPDWRWLLKREDSPWYPGMRLFRQKKPGAWGPVFGNVKGRLEKMLVGEGE